MFNALLVIIFVLLTACQSKPYGHVRVSSSYPEGRCDEIGQVIGNSSTFKGAKEQAIDDMKYQAAQLEGNYVKLTAVTAYGTSVRGIAYRCQGMR